MKTKIKRNYKNSVFTSIFNDKRRLLELYNAIKGTSYKDPNLIRINTLPNVLFLNRQNDISFTIGNKLVILIEHQSSINENMPIRLLIYISRVYEKIINPKNIYHKSLFKIPRPEFIVLYNGVEEYPDEKILKLSDAFEQVEGLKEQIQLDLQVRVLNINKGHNSWMEQRSESLSGYSEFIAKVREFEDKGFNREHAIKRAVSYCINKNILLDYLKSNSSEIMNMLYTKFNMNDALAVSKEEGIAIGEARGEARGIAVGESKGIFRTAKAMLSKGMNTSLISEITGLSKDEIEHIRT